MQFSLKIFLYPPPTIANSSFLLLFGVQSHSVAQASLDLRQLSCLYLPGTGIVGMDYSAQFSFFFFIIVIINYYYQALI